MASAQKLKLKYMIEKNQIVTWTAFAILAIFQVTYKCKPAFAIFVYMSLLFSFVRSFCLSILFIFKRTFLKTMSAFGDLKYLSHAEYNFIRLNFCNFVSVGSVHLILLVIFSTVSLMMDTHSISSDSEITRGGANLE